MSRYEIFPGEANTAILIINDNGRPELTRPGHAPEVLSDEKCRLFLSIRRAAIDMRAKLQLPANQPLRDLFSQEDLCSAFNTDPNSLIFQGDLLAEKTALQDMIDGYDAENSLYKTFHYSQPFQSIEISDAVLAQLAAGSAERARDAKQRYIATQNGNPSVEFLINLRALLLEMADQQIRHGDSNGFLSDEQAESFISDLDARLFQIVSNEIQSNPRLGERSIETLRRDSTLRVSLSELLSRQACIKIRQIYLWKLLHDFRDQFPPEAPLVIPNLIRRLCRAERYDHVRMFGQEPETEDSLAQGRATPPVFFQQANTPPQQRVDFFMQMPLNPDPDPNPNLTQLLLENAIRNENMPQLTRLLQNIPTQRTILEAITAIEAARQGGDAPRYNPR